MTYTVEQKSQLAKLMATENLRVEHQNIHTAMFDPKNRALYLPIWKNMSGDLYDLLCGHEVGHALHTPAEGWHQAAVKTGKPSSYKHFLNVVEDIRIEKKIKRKYPGLRLPFLMAYKELNQRDFFGIKDQNINEYPFIDRLNIFMKTHYNLGIISFSQIEKDFVKRAEETETWEEVVALTDEIFEYSKKEQESLDDVDISRFDMDYYDSSDKDGEGHKYELSETDDDEDDSDVDGGESYKEPKVSSKNKKDQTNEGSDFSNENENQNENENENAKGKIVSVKTSKDFEGKSDYVPICVTDENFRQKENFLVESTGKEYVYLNIPKPIHNNIITSYKDVHRFIKDYYTETIFSESFITKKVKDFKNKNGRFVDLLVKEFEMRKAAKSYNKAKISDTGEINISKLSSYKYDDNIFKKMLTIPKGKNHGLILLLDKSASMTRNLPGSIEQILILSMFCKKVNIPFVVYGFGNNIHARSLDRFPKDISHDYCFDFSETNSLKLDHVFLREYLNSKMSGSEFNSCLRNMIVLAEGFKRGHIPSNESLSNTPLSQAIFALGDIMNDFRRNNCLEISNLIIVHDGDSDSITSFYNTNGIKYIHNFNRNKYILVDKRNKFQNELDFEMDNSNPIFQTSLKWFKETTGSKIFSFFISRGNEKEVIRTKYHDENNQTIQSESLDRLYKKFKNDKFLPLNIPGYDDFYLIFGGKDLESTSESILDKIKDDSSVTELKNAFAKYHKEKNTNRILATRFIQGIAS